MASKRKPVKESRAEYLLRGASARYQNLLLQKIRRLYTDDDYFPREKGRRRKLTPEQKEKMKKINDLLSEYGQILTNDLVYNYGIRADLNWKPSDYTEEQKKIMGDIEKGSRAKKIVSSLFNKTQEGLMGFRYNYCGSGTPIIKYLQSGNPPSTILDFQCMMHDIQYLTIGARALPENQLNTQSNKADNFLEKQAKDILQRVGEDSRLGKEASTVASAMRVKKFFQRTKLLKPSLFIGEIPQFSDDAKRTDEQRKKAAEFLISEFNSATAEEYYDEAIKEGLSTAIDKKDFEIIADGLEALLQRPGKLSIFEFDDEVRRKTGFSKGKLGEEIFLKQRFGDDNEDIDNFADAESMTSKPIDPRKVIGFKPEFDEPPSFARATAEQESTGRAPAVDPEAPPEQAGLGEEEEEKDEPEEEGERLIDPSDPVKETPVDIDELRKQRDRVGQEERVDLKADPPMSAMALTDAKPVVGERNMRPTLFREEGDTIELSRRQEQENRMFYENFTWIDAGFGNGNIQRLPNEMYAGRDIANNRLYDAQVKNQMLKYSGDLFVGNQQYRKKYDISARTRRLVKTPMHSTVQHHQQFIRDSSLPAGAGRKHQMARDNPSWMPEKNVNSRVGHLYYPDVVDGNRV